MSEDLKSIEEIAKTAGKAIDASEKFGGFIAKFISGSLEQGIGIFEDRLKYMRWERQVRLMKKSEEFMESINFKGPTKPIPLKLAIPLFQAATLEDDDYLQDLWIKLLVNSSNNESNVKLCRTYIDILEKLSPLEARILITIYSHPFNEIEHRGVFTIGLPEEAIPYSHEDIEKISEYHLENEQVLFALANLSRLGCISVQKSIGGGEIFNVVNPTLLGKYLVESFTIKDIHESLA